MKHTIQRYIHLGILFVFSTQGIAFALDDTPMSSATVISVSESHAQGILQAFALFKSIPNFDDAQRLLNEAKTILNEEEISEGTKQKIKDESSRLSKAYDLSQKLTTCSGMMTDSGVPSVGDESSSQTCPAVSQVESSSTIHSQKENLEKVKTFSDENNFVDSIVQDLTGYFQTEKNKTFNKKDTLTQFQTAMNDMKAAKVVPRYYDSIIEFSKQNNRGSFKPIHDQYKPIFFQAGGEYLPLADETTGQVIDQDIELMTSLSHGIAFQRQHGPDSYHLKPDQFPDRLQRIYGQSVLTGRNPFSEFEEFSKSAMTPLLNGTHDPLQFLFPEPFEFYKPASQTATSVFLKQHEDWFYEQYPKDRFIEIISRHPLLYTEKMRSVLENINDTPADAPIVQDSLFNEVILERQNQLAKEISYVENLKREKPMDALKELIVHYPVFVWQKVSENPDAAPLLCQAYHEIRADEAFQKKVDQAKLILGIVAGSLAVLSGVGIFALTAAGLGTTYAAGITYATLATSGLSLGTGFVFLGGELNDASKNNQSYQRMYSSILADLGGDEKTALEKLRNFKTHIINAVITGTLLPVDVAMIFTSIGSLRNLEEIDQLAQYAPELLATASTVSKSAPLEFQKAIAQQKIQAVVQAVRDPELGIFLGKVADGVSISDTLRPYAQRYLMEALHSAEASGFKDLTKFQKLKDGLSTLSDFQKDLDLAIQELRTAQRTQAHPQVELRAGSEATLVNVTPEAQYLTFGKEMEKEVLACARKIDPKLASDLETALESTPINQRFELLQKLKRSSQNPSVLEYDIRDIPFQEQIQKVRQTLAPLTVEEKARYLVSQLEAFSRELPAQQRESYLLLLGNTMDNPELQVRVLQKLFEAGLSPDGIQSIGNLLPHPATLMRNPEKTILRFLGDTQEKTPTGVAAWHEMSGQEAENMWSSQGLKLTRGDSVYSINAKQIPNEPGIETFSVRHTNGIEAGDTVFPVTREGEAIPKVFTGNAHPQLLGLLLTTSEGRQALQTLAKSMTAYRSTLTQVASQLSGKSFTLDDFTKAYLFLKRNYGQVSQTAPIIEEITSQTFFMVGGQAGNLRSPAQALQAAQRIDEGIQSLDDLARVARPLTQ